MITPKPLTLADARSRAETMAKVAEGRLKDFPRNIDAGQWRVDSQMFRLLLAASEAGPGTEQHPTGAGDFDLVCKGCHTEVTTPHTWEECTKLLCGQVVELTTQARELAEGILTNSTPDPDTRALARIVLGHDVECTGTAAQWCPNCGDCTCVNEEDRNDDTCPLHGSDTSHGEMDGDQ
jgi:hypothetical protein